MKKPEKNWRLLNGVGTIPKMKSDYPDYSLVEKSRENFVFRPKMAIFRRAGMKEGGLPLPLAFQYFIFMICRACDLNLVMISSLASKCQHFKLRGL